MGRTIFGPLQPSLTNPQVAQYVDHISKSGRPSGSCHLCNDADLPLSCCARLHSPNIALPPCRGPCLVRLRILLSNLRASEHPLALRRYLKLANVVLLPELHVDVHPWQLEFRGERTGFTAC